MIAETYSIWTLYLAPMLLKGCFLNEHYYNHFVKLVQLLTCCIDLEITHEEIDDLNQSFQKWVQDYERYMLPPLTSILFNGLPGSTVKMIWIVFHAAHSLFMPCCILLQPSELWAQSGPIGHSQWNAIVAASFATSGVNGSPTQASTDMLHCMHS